ncbi:MAG: DMT family transporter [Bacteroidales bacterium]|nr:DMT family transporter [Bacteroidales bacterium]
MSNKVKGYLLGIVASCAYGMNPLFTLPLYSHGMSPNTVLLLRYFIAIFIVIIMMKTRGRSFSVERGNIPMLILLGILMAASSLTLYVSYKYIDAGVASTLLFVYPIMVALIMIFVFHERLSIHIILSTIAALVGIALINQVDGGVTLNAMGVFMVFISSLTYAVYIVLINQSRMRNVPTLTVTLYVLLFGSLFYIIGAIYNNDFSLPHEWQMWGCAISLAVLPTAISFVCTTKAIQYIGSTPTAILGALEPVTAVFFGITVFGEQLSSSQWIGLTVILIAVTWVVMAGSSTKQIVNFRKLFPKKNRRE